MFAARVKNLPWHQLVEVTVIRLDRAIGCDGGTGCAAAFKWGAARRIGVEVPGYASNRNSHRRMAGAISRIASHQGA